MPLHIDRTTVQAQQSRGEHVVDLTARTRQAAGPDAAQSQDDSSPVLRLVGVSTPDTGDVASVEAAEQLVRSLMGGGASATLAAHGALDPDRVSALLAG